MAFDTDLGRDRKQQRRLKWLWRPVAVACGGGVAALAWFFGVSLIYVIASGVAMAYGAVLIGESVIFSKQRYTADGRTVSDAAEATSREMKSEMALYPMGVRRDQGPISQKASENEIDDRVDRQALCEKLKNLKSELARLDRTT